MQLVPVAATELESAKALPYCAFVAIQLLSGKFPLSKLSKMFKLPGADGADKIVNGDFTIESLPKALLAFNFTEVVPELANTR